MFKERTPLPSETSSDCSHPSDSLTISENGSSDDDLPIYSSSSQHCEEHCLVYELDDGSRIVCQGVIGRGHYGTVYRGQQEYDDSVTEVAIKQFNVFSGIPDKNLLRDFEREIKIMQTLRHPNIVKIITYIEHPTSIIMEFIKHRSFLVYLITNGPSLTTQRLLKFAKDIARGMEYLVSKNIVHRDLAARNVLVHSDDCVKISDFGLAQVTDSNGYYTMQNYRDIPIKWYTTP